jgi:hypothetical protein
LINVKILPFQGGLSIEGKKLSSISSGHSNESLRPCLVTIEIDPPNVLAKDLSVFHKHWENLSIEDFSGANNEDSSWSMSDSTESEHGGYVRCDSSEEISEEGSEEDSDVSYKATDRESEDSGIESEES